jgi:hypothetical protein
MEILYHHYDCSQARNPGLQAATDGSRKRSHKISGSVKSIGFSTP